MRGVLWTNDRCIPFWTVLFLLLDILGTVTARETSSDPGHISKRNRICGSTVLPTSFLVESDDAYDSDLSHILKSYGGPQKHDGTLRYYAQGLPTHELPREIRFKLSEESIFHASIISSTLSPKLSLKSSTDNVILRSPKPEDNRVDITSEPLGPGDYKLVVSEGEGCYSLLAVIEPLASLVRQTNCEDLPRLPDKLELPIRLKTYSMPAADLFGDGVLVGIDVGDASNNIRVSISFNPLLAKMGVKLEGSDGTLIQEGDSATPMAHAHPHFYHTHTLSVFTLPSGTYNLKLSAKSPGVSAHELKCVRFDLAAETVGERPEVPVVTSVSPPSGLVDPSNDLRISINFSAPVTLGVAGSQHGVNFARSGAVTLHGDAGRVLPESLKFVEGRQDSLVAVFRRNMARLDSQGKMLIDLEQFRGVDGFGLALTPLASRPHEIEYRFAKSGAELPEGGGFRASGNARRRKRKKDREEKTTGVNSDAEELMEDILGEDPLPPLPPPPTTPHPEEGGDRTQHEQNPQVDAKPPPPPPPIEKQAPPPPPPAVIDPEEGEIVDPQEELGEDEGGRRPSEPEEKGGTRESEGTGQSIPMEAEGAARPGENAAEVKIPALTQEDNGLKGGEIPAVTQGDEPKRHVLTGVVEAREPNEKEIQDHGKRAEESLDWAKNAVKDSCEFKLHGKCISPQTCEEELCHGQGYCINYSSGTACACDPGYASSGGKFCNVCESDVLTYPSCALESVGDKLAEAIAMERICNVFQLPYSLGLPGMLGSRHTFFLKDWFKAQTLSTTVFNVTKESFVRVHIIPRDPKDVFEVRLVDISTGGRDKKANAEPVKEAPALAHERVMRVTVNEGSFLLEVGMVGDPGPKDRNCKKFHFHLEITPTIRVFSPAYPYSCPRSSTVPALQLEKLEKTKDGEYKIPSSGLEYASEGGQLASSGVIHTSTQAREVFKFNFVAENVVGMIPYIDAQLSSDFVPGHMRLAIRRLDREILRFTMGERGSSRENGYFRGEAAASTQVFVANSDPEPNHISLDLTPGVPYRLEIFEVLPRLPDAKCAFYDLTLAIDYVDMRGTGHGDEGKDGFVDDRCDLAALPRTFDIPGYLGYYPGYSWDPPRRMHAHEVYRYNPNVEEHRIRFTIDQGSLIRVYVPFHQTQLTVRTAIVEVVHDRKGRTIATGSNAVNDDVSAELQSGEYELVFTFNFADSLVKTPGSMRCIGFETEIALAPLYEIGGGAHWCGPNREVTREHLPQIHANGTKGGYKQAYVMVAEGGKIDEHILSFNAPHDNTLVEVSIDSDFVSGHLSALIKQKSKDSLTRLVLPAHQTAPNHASLIRTIPRGEYELIIRPLFVFRERTCVPFDFHLLLSNKDLSAEAEWIEERRIATTGVSANTFRHCAAGGFEPMPSTLNSARYLGGSGQLHATHFAGKYYAPMPDGSTEIATHFSIAKRSKLRASINLEDGSAHGAIFKLLFYDCLSQPPYPYVGVQYAPKGGGDRGGYPCVGKVVWEDITVEFSRVEILETGYYQLVAGYHVAGAENMKDGSKPAIEVPCVKFHLELAIDILPSKRRAVESSREREGHCFNSADHLPPHPPSILSEHYHYDSQRRRERLTYQAQPGRKLSFMAPFQAERPFRLIVEIGYDFLPGDLRIDLARYNGARDIERIFRGRPLAGRRRRLAASVLPPGSYALWMHAPPDSSVDSSEVESARGEWRCIGFTWRLEVHVLESQTAHRLDAGMLHPELQERLPPHPPLPLSLNRAGCLVPTGECELFGIFAVMHQVWNANLPSQNWEENSVSFSIAKTSLVRVHASPLVLGAMKSHAVLRIRLVSLGSGPGSGEEKDLQSPRGGWANRDSTLDDWLIKQLHPGSYALVLNVKYPGTQDAWHAWRMHFTVSLHVAVSHVDPNPGGLWGLPRVEPSGHHPDTCPGKPCGEVLRLDPDFVSGPGAVWKLDEESEQPCLQQKERGAPDPSCAYGIKSEDGMTCCHADCGRCGGENCHLLPLGPKACCGSGIKEHAGSCALKSAPCIVFGEGSKVVRTIIIPVSQPEGISLVAETSFGFLHQHLGILLEGHTVGYSPTGRVIKRNVKFKGIPQHTSSYLDLDLGPGLYNLTLTELGPAPAAHLGPCGTRNYSFLIYIKSKVRAQEPTRIDSTQKGVPNPHAETVAEWKKLLDDASNDHCALPVSLPESLLPLPENLRNFKSSENAPSLDGIFKSSRVEAATAAVASAAYEEGSKKTFLQTWGGNGWARVHANGFNLVRTGAAAVALAQMKIRGEGAAFAMRIQAPPRKGGFIVRVSASTNSAKEQLLFALVNASGSYIPPTVHSPSSRVNPAFFILGDAPKAAGEEETRVSGDPMDELLGDGRGVLSSTTSRDYYLLLQPRRRIRSETVDDEECPLFSLDLAAAPESEIHNWMKNGPPSSDWKCEEITPNAPTIPIGFTQKITSEAFGRYTSATKGISIKFQLHKEAEINVTILHNFLLADFTLSLLKLPKEGSADKPPATLATSSDNVFTFGKDDNPEAMSAGGESHVLLAEQDVGAALMAQITDGDYELLISEHTLKEHRNGPEDILCVDFFFSMDIVPVERLFNPTSKPRPEPEPTKSQIRAETNENEGSASEVEDLPGERDDGHVSEQTLPPSPLPQTSPSEPANCKPDSCGCKYGPDGECQAIGSCSIHSYGSYGRVETHLLCRCPKNYDGPRCEECARGYKAYPDCIATMKAVIKPLHPGLLSNVVPQGVDKRPRIVVLMAYTLTVVACLFILVSIFVHLRKRRSLAKLYSRDGASVYTYREDGL
ncbi:hypothetical protein AAMO2058_000297400 [Amorphochlora amoebiformis]